MKPPIFIIGNPRSGTTLLRLMLTCHPNICIPPECGWLIGMYTKWGDTSYPVDIEKFVTDLQKPEVRKFETWGISSKELIKGIPGNACYYPAVATAVYEYYMQKYQPGKIRWGDKNNFFLHHIDTIDKIFPEALFIHIVRDGRDVACSYRDMAKIRGKYVPRLPSAIGDIAQRWMNNLSIIEFSLNKLDYRCSTIVRYEDLVTNTESTLKEVCCFIGENYDSKMLDFDKINRKEKLEPDETIRWKKLTKKPVTDSRVKRWKQELTEDEQILFEFIAHRTLKRYGY